MSNMITKDQLKQGRAYPVGEYELEIKDCEHKEGVNADKKSWQTVVLRCEIVSPETLAGKPFTTSLFYDSRLADIITIGIGKNLEDVFGKDNAVDNEKLFALMRGQFIKVRLGVDQKGFNKIAECLPPNNEQENTTV